ncbi:hypothetical protein AB0L83_35445 [Streptomyces sp. NPDC052071]|uniref:hypothetical protein n=1 Tax=Streptomyces sp. NPDC052071 TaxID=3156666 RepID=UPI003437491F
MKVYKDVFSGDELLSASFPIKEEGICYVVEAKHSTRAAGLLDIGGTDGEEADSMGHTVLNVAEAHQLVATTYEKKHYTRHIKAYLKRITECLPAEERIAWQQQAREWIEQVLADFDGYEFFTGGRSDRALIAAKRPDCWPSRADRCRRRTAAGWRAA